MGGYRTNNFTRAIQAIVNPERGGDAKPMLLQHKTYQIQCLVKWTKLGRLQVYTIDPLNPKQMIMFYAGFEWLRYGETYELDEDWVEAFKAVHNAPVVLNEYYPFSDKVGYQFIPNPRG